MEVCGRPQKETIYLNVAGADDEMPAPLAPDEPSRNQRLEGCRLPL
jgi:hypothetical protein